MWAHLPPFRDRFLTETGPQVPQLILSPAHRFPPLSIPPLAFSLWGAPVRPRSSLHHRSPPPRCTAHAPCPWVEKQTWFDPPLDVTGPEPVADNAPVRPGGRGRLPPRPSCSRRLETGRRCWSKGVVAVPFDWKDKHGTWTHETFQFELHVSLLLRDPEALE